MNGPARLRDSASHRDAAGPWEQVEARLPSAFPWSAFARPIEGRLDLRAAFGEARSANPLDPFCEPGGRSAPPELVDVLEEGRIRPQRRQRLEQQRGCALFSEHLGRKRFDRTVAVQQAGGTD